MFITRLVSLGSFIYFKINAPSPIWPKFMSKYTPPTVFFARRIHFVIVRRFLRTRQIGSMYARVTEYVRAGKFDGKLTGGYTVSG